MALNSFSVVEVSSSSSELRAIGRLRCEVWEAEGSLDRTSFPEGEWVDAEDAQARHWIARSEEGVLVGAARLLVHHSLDTADRDVALWQRIGRELKFPVADLGRLVVPKSHRNRGVATALNRVRVAAAATAGAATIICTASKGNRPLLLREGFVDTGATISFDDRPGTLFYALELVLPVSVDPA